MATPTLRTLAKSLGLSRTTVSDALRGSPRVKSETLQRVQAAAKAAGYERNPLTGAVMSLLRRSRGQQFRGVLGVLEMAQPGRAPHVVRYSNTLLKGISEVPPLRVASITRKDFDKWFAKHEPDVVLGHFPEAIAWMKAAGAKFPRTHAFVCLNSLRAEEGECAALDLQTSELGGRATELVIAQLLHNEFGIPERPSLTTIPAKLIEGATLRPRLANSDIAAARLAELTPA